MALLPRDASFGDPWDLFNHFYLGTESECSQVYFGGPGSINVKQSRHCSKHKGKIKCAQRFHNYVKLKDGHSGLLKIVRSAGTGDYSDNVFLERVTVDDTVLLVWGWVTEKMSDNIRPETIRKYLSWISWHAMVICGFKLYST